MMSLEIISVSHRIFCVLLMIHVVVADNEDLAYISL